MAEDLEALAKAGGEILNDQSVRQFIGRVTGEPSSELGGLVGDRIRFWRFRQAIKLCQRAKQLLEEAGLEAHEVRPAVLVPVLEGGALAGDDEDLQERWAALLANAAATPTAIPPSFPYILGQLSATDAKLLDVCFSWPTATAAFEERGWVHGQEDIHAREAARRAGIEGRDFELALDNLIRLRVIHSKATYGGLVSETVLLTTLGYEFVRACKPPSEDAEESDTASEVE